ARKPGRLPGQPRVIRHQWCRLACRWRCAHRHAVTGIANVVRLPQPLRISAMPATVILVHGLRTSATLFRQQLEELRELGIPCDAVGLPGHGRRIGERFTLDAALKTIDDAVTAAETSGTKPYLVGFSLGGYLAIEWVARNPDRVAGLLAAACGTVPSRVIMHGWRVGGKVKIG